MARIDKYCDGFRAPLAAAFTGGTNGVDFGKVICVGLNANGQVTASAPASGYLGVMVLHESFTAGEQVDVMDRGEIVEFDQEFNAPTGAATSGTTYYADSTTNDGQFFTTAPAAGVNAVKIGTTVEDDRLIVRVTRIQG